ncbi:MAG: hypothetical protein ACFFAS_15145 [Promethearchaeota archaeon]
MLAFIDALNNCEAALELARASGDGSLIDKYGKTLTTIKTQIEEVLKESSNITNNLEFERSLSNLDEMFQLIQVDDFKEYKERLEKKQNALVQQKNILVPSLKMKKYNPSYT